MNNVDVAVFRWANSIAADPAAGAYIHFAGHTLPFIAGAAFALLLALPLFFERFRNYSVRHREMAVVALGGALFARFVVTELIRFLYDRPRPFEALADVNLAIVREGGGSFPSGHAVFFFALAAGIWPYHKKTASALLAAALITSLGRVAAGLHWPSDVLGGAAIGIFVCWILHRHVRTVRSDI